VKRLAIFVSGSGSDMQSVIDGIERKEIDAEIVLVVASKPGIYAIERAEKYGIPHEIYCKKDYDSLEGMYERLIARLKALDVDYVLLAGYLTILTPNMIQAFPNRIVNIHPSLIPAFCGKGFYGLKVHQAAIDYGVKLTGVTVHFVDEGADTGCIIAQEAVSVKSTDTAEELQKRVLEVEHRLLPEVMALICRDKVHIEGRKVSIE
jgi:phosphoribosylglycinamide formyltransferase